MFENIIGNKIVVNRISDEINKGIFPSSTLISGPEYSGKLTLALEIARVLACSKGGAWNCRCRSCNEHRYLDNPDLLCTGDGEFFSEIYAAGETYKLFNDKAAMFLFIRSIRKFLMRFDPVLWENSNKISKAEAKFEKLNDLINSLSPDAEEQKKQKNIDKIIALAESLSSVLPSGGISVDQVRNIKNWVYTSGGNRTRTIILENADRMNSSVRNALLKVLEEPPENVYFILLTSNKSGIMPTILSRVRCYSLPYRNRSESEMIISKVFRENELKGYCIEDFFLANRGIKSEALEGDAEKFLNCVIESKNKHGLYPAEIIDKYSDKALFVPFLSKLVSEMHKILLKESDYPEHTGFVYLFDKWSTLVNKSKIFSDSYNVSPRNILENLFFDMKKEG
jgi:DNA polymerase-3 subunit gamma/tau